MMSTILTRPAAHRAPSGRPRVDHDARVKRPRLRAALAAVAVAVVVTVASACSSRIAGTPVSLPAPATGEVTFYLSLPGSTSGLSDAAVAVSTPGSSNYRHFDSLATAAHQFGATDAQINTIATSVETLGLQFAADPTRLFARVTGSTAQWQAALGTPLTVQAATASNPFTTYGLPAKTPSALHPSGVAVLLPSAQVYDSGAEGRHPPSGHGPAGGLATTASATEVALPWPLNAGTPFTAGCAAPPLQQGQVYTEQQVQTAYGVDTLRAHATGTPVITVLDLGGGWLPSGLQLAGKCFGYSPPQVDQLQGDGVVAAIANADPETSLDLETAAAVVPTAQLRLVQTTPGGGGILDGFSRALGGPSGLPDVISLSYGGCSIQENTADPAFTAAVDAVLAMAALTGVSTFVAAGDSGSTTCGTSVSGTSLSYPAVSPFVTAVGGSRLTLGPGNTRVSETVWNDSVYGASAAGGGALSRREPRPAYQDGSVPQNHRAVPDVSALADIVPGWPDVTDSALQPVGNNDLADVGCCQATAGYDLASGLGVPNWAVLPAALPTPGSG